MSPRVPTQLFSRHIAICILLFVGCCFASAHIAARIAFDDGAGILTALVARSGTSLLLLILITIALRRSFKIAPALVPWQIALGLLIALQGIFIYSAIARIPIGIALLAVNTFPIQYALLNWAIGGKAPSRSTMILMGSILFGLLLALDIPQLVQTDAANIKQWLIGIGCGFLAAFSFSNGIWITENKLGSISGSTRTLYVMLVVCLSGFIVGHSPLFTNALSLPTTTFAWAMLALLSLLYACGFITLFMLTPRLHLAQNAPALNIEPVASLFLAWIILGQALSPIQVIGGVIVVSCIIAFAYMKK